DQTPTHPLLVHIGPGSALQLRRSRMLGGLTVRSPAPAQWPRRAADIERLVVSASSSGASDVAGCGATGPPSALAGTPAWCWRRRYLGLWRSDSVVTFRRRSVVMRPTFDERAASLLTNHVLPHEDVVPPPGRARVQRWRSPAHRVRPGVRR